MTTIDIEDNVPLPEPSKPDTWANLKPPSEAKPVAPKSDPYLDGIMEKVERRRPQPYPEGCVECMFIGGPLNGQRGPVKGNAKVVEIELYGAKGEVISVELYALGDNPTPTFRHHVGTKAP